jgi:hypothetical protein
MVLEWGTVHERALQETAHTLVFLWIQGFGEHDPNDRKESDAVPHTSRSQTDLLPVGDQCDRGEPRKGEIRGKEILAQKHVLTDISCKNLVISKTLCTRNSFSENI